MKISYEIYQYTLPYHPPFPERSGYLLRLMCEDEEKWGEIAPLPGRSRETSVEALGQLTEVLRGDIESISFDTLFPSVAFGLFSAMHYKPWKTALPLSALLAGTIDEILSKAQLAASQGYTSAKVKVSGLELHCIPELVAHLTSLFTVRIDANRCFSFKEAMQLCERCTMQNIEYIEEPTWEVGMLDHFPYPFALDESALELAKMPTSPHFQALVFKPSVLGLPRKKGEIVLSSACETGVGILGIASLADALSLEIFPLGLDTYRFLCQDILSTPLDFSTGVLCSPEKIDVDTSRLQLIAHG